MARLKQLVSAMLIVTLVPQLIGCEVNTLQRVAPARLRPQELYAPAGPRIVGITTPEGTVVTFDSLAERQTADTLYAWVHDTPFRVGRHSVLRVWVARPGEQTVSVAPSAVTPALVAKPPIRGVTTVGGDKVSFDRGANAYVIRDTRGASAAGNPFALPLQRAQVVWVSRHNQVLSIILSLPLVFLAAGTLFAIGNLGGGIHVGLPHGL